MTGPAAPVLEARSVSKRWREARGRESVALVDVSLAVPPGAFLALCGPSGSGKSTLLALLGALERPTEGTVLAFGRDLAGTSDAERARVRRRIGFAFQSAPMIRGLPLWENVTYPLVPLGARAADRRARAGALLAEVGLPDLLEKRPETLSAGELQRAGLARALVAGPPVILADEPTSSLDAENAAAIAGLLAGLHGRGTTIVVATHDPRLVEASSLVARLDRGRLSAA